MRSVGRIWRVILSDWLYTRNCYWLRGILAKCHAAHVTEERLISSEATPVRIVGNGAIVDSLVTDVGHGSVDLVVRIGSSGSLRSP